MLFQQFKIILSPCALVLASLFLMTQVTADPNDVGNSQKTVRTTAISLQGDTKYPKNFRHFEYASPAAIKGGTLRDFAIGTYDSLNPFIVKGTPAANIFSLYETLFTSSYDEVFSMYGLVAESVEYPEDRSWVIYHINPKARFHDGHPITAEDVVFSFNLLVEKGLPTFAQYYADVAKVEALDKYRVKYSFKTTKNRELMFIVGQTYVLPKHFWEGKDFEKSSLEIPLGSGPYRIKKFEAGRSITYERVKDYWGEDLPVNVGFNNFDNIQIDYYRDKTVVIEALKAGQIDIRSENSANSWATAYDSPAVKSGQLIKREIPDHSTIGMQGFVVNLRRSPFDNMKFRQALNYAFDFEWVNKTVSHGAYTRLDSYFFNSELAAKGLPKGRELEILKAYKGRIPDTVFTQPYTNPVTDGSGNNRENLRKAKQLLKEAGFMYKDGKLINPKDQKPVVIEYIDTGTSAEQVANPYAKNLKRLGIELNYRLIDTSQYINRVQSHDFDMVVLAKPGIKSPGNEQREYWGSKAADTKGSMNYGGIKNPVIDELIEALIVAPTREELVAYARALDRVLLHNHYIIPQFGLTYNRVAHWDKFGMPKTPPRYDQAFSVTPMTWWIDPEKEKKLQGAAGKSSKP